MAEQLWKQKFCPQHNENEWANCSEIPGSHCEIPFSGGIFSNLLSKKMLFLTINGVGSKS